MNNPFHSPLIYPSITQIKILTAPMILVRIGGSKQDNPTHLLLDFNYSGYNMTRTYILTKANQPIKKKRVTTKGKLPPDGLGSSGAMNISPPKHLYHQ